MRFTGNILKFGTKFGNKDIFLSRLPAINCLYPGFRIKIFKYVRRAQSAVMHKKCTADCNRFLVQNKATIDATVWRVESVVMRNLGVCLAGAIGGNVKSPLISIIISF